MRPEEHLRNFEELKETIITWGLQIQGVEKSQRTIGLTASRAIIEILSAYLHRTGKLDLGGIINHRWLSSVNQADRHIPNFPERDKLVPRLVDIENRCTTLAYGRRATPEEIKDVIALFKELSEEIERLLAQEGVK